MLLIRVLIQFALVTAVLLNGGANIFVMVVFVILILIIFVMLRAMDVFQMQLILRELFKIQLGQIIPIPPQKLIKMAVLLMLIMLTRSGVTINIHHIQISVIT
jgi:hypothetical protein